MQSDATPARITEAVDRTAFAELPGIRREEADVSKRHSGVAGNEAADPKANLAVYGSRVRALPDKVTPAGIRQEYPIHHKPKHLGWSRKGVKSLTYIATDRGPLRSWLKTI